MSDTLSKSLLATQQYLRSGKTLENFNAEHGIRGKADADGHLILDYDQINVKWSEPFGFVCRGLILNAKTFDLIGFGLSKFFNHGEGYAAPIDWSTARAFEKIDGSMVMRWFSPITNQFEFSTRYQLPENLRVNTTNTGIITWENLIKRCLADWDPILMEQPKNETWVFEICSKENMVVVRHAGYYAKLLAARNIDTLEEIKLDSLPGSTSMKPQSYQFSQPQEVVEFANKFSATQNEGFVVCDSAFNRIKIKSDEYVALHRLKDGLTGINALISLAKGNDYEEIITHFPEYKPDLDAVANLISETISRHELVFDECNGIVAQKDFALEIQGRGLEHTSSLFLTRAKKQPSVRAAFFALEETQFNKIFKEKVRALLGAKYAEENSSET
jgi:hypothetical protein